MMYLLRKCDVFGYAENDVMFALCAVSHTSLGEAVIISETASFAEGKHH